MDYISGRLVGQFTFMILMVSLFVSGSQVFAQDFHLEYGPPKNVVAHIAFVQHYPRFAIERVAVALAKPPLMPGRQNLRVEYHIAGLSVARPSEQVEASPLMRTVYCSQFSLRRPVHDLTIQISYTGTLQTIRLAPGRPLTPVLPLEPAMRTVCLATDRELNFKDATFQAYLDRESARFQPGDKPLDFAYKCYRYITQRFTYGDGPPHLLTNLAREPKTDCGGVSQFFVGLCRANGIPARLLVGRWAISGKDDAPMDQCHCMAEFWVDGIGWIPVDATSGLGKPEADGLDFFGKFNGNLLVFHYGIDLPISERDGKHSEAVVQGPATYMYTSQGGQSFNGATSGGTWRVAPQ